MASQHSSHALIAYSARAFAFLLCLAGGFYYLGFPWGIGIGFFVGTSLVLAERGLRDLALRRVVGGAVGLSIGLILGGLGAKVIEALILPAPARGGLTALAVLVLAYLGLVVGIRRGGSFSWPEMIAQFRGGEMPRTVKILDTSVIIDGRVADIVEAGFIEGILVIPTFVLNELQAVADSSDPLKQSRGRKGLDVLQELKRGGASEVEITDTDFPDVREVDQKLIELARYRNAPILTNDFNLNKVARLRGVQVMNINDLANALKPVVLPGENLSVFLVKEGKEKDQAVAYLDDGTMVVVDGARHLIGTKIDVVVTSHLQTSAGKMIFGVWKDDAERRNMIRQRKAE